jgi:hypothetical protein
METKKIDLDSVLRSYSIKLDKSEQFYHILKEIKGHDSKLKKLKKEEDRPGHFKEEVCDVFILANLLMELEGVSQKELDKASKHISDKVKEIYEN